jgi:hypothetical protein
VHLAAEHNAISPRPREIKYGADRLALRGLKVCLVSPAAGEDRFAARELASTLSIPFQEDSCPDRAIKLNRTGESEPLPRPGEKTGSNSRESYSVHVAAGSATVSARSSAGLYYAFQTLRQMVEGSPDSAYLPEVEIRDWPALAYRGFMMDMSHAQLPAVDEIKRQIDFLARWTNVARRVLSAYTALAKRQLTCDREVARGATLFASSMPGLHAPHHGSQSARRSRDSREGRDALRLEFL